MKLHRICITESRDFVEGVTFSETKTGQAPLERSPKKVMPRKKSRGGFTLIEILIVVGLFSVLLGMGLIVSFGTYQRYIFRTEHETFISFLEKTRSEAMANIDGVPHGVIIDSANKSYTVFEGDSFNKDDPKNQTVAPGSNFSISPSVTVLFAQMTGDSSFEGDIVLTDGIRIATTSINHVGKIE